MALNLPEEGDFETPFKTSKERNIGLTGQKEIPAGLIKDKEYKIIVPAQAFTSSAPDTDEVNVTLAIIEPQSGSVTFYAPINIPNGAKVISAIVYGSAGEDWALRRTKPSDGTGEFMFSAQVGTRDDTISTTAPDKDIINNSLYAYFFHVASLEVGDFIRAGELTFIFEDPEIID